MQIYYGRLLSFHQGIPFAKFCSAQGYGSRYMSKVPYIEIVPKTTQLGSLTSQSYILMGDSVKFQPLLTFRSPLSIDS